MPTTVHAAPPDLADMQHVEPPCPYFGACGGCALQDLSYAKQLQLKRERLERELAPLGVSGPLELVPSEPPWRYRNKAEFSFGEVEGRLVLGYHAARSFWRVVDLDDCLLMPDTAMLVLRDLRRLAEASGQPAYQPRTHRGFFRFAVIRVSRATGHVLLTIVTTSGSGEMIHRLAEALLARHPSLAGIYWGVTDRLADVASAEALHHVRGRTTLEERLGPFRLELPPTAFLQPNLQQAQRLYEQLVQLVEPVTDPRASVVWDLYCGLGLVSCYLSCHVRRLYGIEVDPASLDAARRQAALNRIENVTFQAGRVETVLADRRFWLGEGKPDVIVVDPPRSGLHPSVLGALLAARPHHLAYLSCNPRSLARDLAELTTHYPRYRVHVVKAFDGFPQTPHVEVLAFLERT